MQSFILKASSTPTKGFSWLTSRVTAADSKSGTGKSLVLLEQFGFRLLKLRFNVCVGSASTLQSKAPTQPQCLACLARDSFGWNELGLSLCHCTCTWCILASHHPCLSSRPRVCLRVHNSQSGNGAKVANCVS